MQIDTNFYAQAVMAVLVITWPPDPVKILVFNSIADESDLNRTAAASKAALYRIAV